MRAQPHGQARYRAAGDQEMSWSCESCTFLNEPFATTCDICQTARGGGSSGAGGGGGGSGSVSGSDGDALSAALVGLRDVAQELRVRSYVYYQVSHECQAWAPGQEPGMPGGLVRSSNGEAMRPRRPHYTVLTRPAPRHSRFTKPSSR